MKTVHMRPQIYSNLFDWGWMLHRGYYWSVLRKTQSCVFATREVPDSDIKETVRVVINREKA